MDEAPSEVRLRATKLIESSVTQSNEEGPHNQHVDSRAQPVSHQTQHISSYLAERIQESDCDRTLTGRTMATTPIHKADNHGGPLSWQAAFWNVLAVALNTMTQPSGMILGFPSSLNFYLRLSPTVCLMNVLTTILYLASQQERKGSFTEELRAWKTERFADRESAAEGGFESLRRNTIFRAGLFIMCALPQAVKLYSCSGLFLTQVLCSIYLASFLLDEVLAALCALADHQTESPYSSRSRTATLHASSRRHISHPQMESFAGFIVAADCGLMGNLLLRIAAPTMPIQSFTFPLWMLVATLPFTMMMVRFFGMPIDWHKPEELWWLVPMHITYLTFPAIVLFNFVFLSSVPQSAHADEHNLISLILRASAFLVGFIVVPVPFVLLACGLVHPLNWALDRLNLAAVNCFQLYAGMLLLIGILTYANFYDATGMYKAPWLEVFS